MRLYAKTDFVAFFSETPIPISVLRPFISELIDWIASKSPRLIFDRSSTVCGKDSRI